MPSVFPEKSYHFWFLAFPDLPKPIGGVKQIHRVSEALNSLGYSSTVVQDDASYRPKWFSSSVNTISKKDFFKHCGLNESNDIIVLPETFIAGLNSIHQTIPKIIFNQNVGYTYGMPNVKFPSPGIVHTLYRHQSVKQIWCVSEYDRVYLSSTLGIPISKIHRIINYVESVDFEPIVRKKWISYMPRKNQAHSDIVVNLLSSQAFLKGWKIVPIAGLSNKDVLKVLTASHIFLPFGYPEGFGLPIAEALATGCSIVGYHGLGGKELFEIARQYGCGYSVEYGDFYGFITGIYSLLKTFELNKSQYLDSASVMSKHVQKLYSKNSMISSVVQAIRSLSLSD